MIKIKMKKKMATHTKVFHTDFKMSCNKLIKKKEFFSFGEGGLG